MLGRVMTTCRASLRDALTATKAKAAQPAIAITRSTSCANLDLQIGTRSHWSGLPCYSKAYRRQGIQEAVGDFGSARLSAITDRFISEGGRMHALMLDLLAFCRAGQAEMAIEPINPQAIIDTKIMQLKTNVDYQGVDMHGGNSSRQPAGRSSEIRPDHQEST